jgi:hypothetical protein
MSPSSYAIASKQAMKRCAWLVAFAFLSHAAVADDVPALPAAEEVKALRGLEYRFDLMGQKVTEHLSCTQEGNGSVTANGIDYDDWSDGLVKCQNLWVVTLSRSVGKPQPRGQWRIVDTLVLPPVQFDPDPDDPEALRFIGGDNCDIKGIRSGSVIILARFGNRQTIDWRTGVEKAWTFDPKRGRIVPLSTKRIVCDAYEP